MRGRIYQQRQLNATEEAAKTMLPHVLVEPTAIQLFQSTCHKGRLEPSNLDDTLQVRINYRIRNYETKA